jgi:hypothetical protein
MSFLDYNFTDDTTGADLRTGIWPESGPYISWYRVDWRFKEGSSRQVNTIIQDVTPGGKWLGSAARGGFHRADIAPPSAEYDVNFVIRCRSTLDTGSELSVIARATPDTTLQSETSGYAVRLANSNGNPQFLRIDRVVHGVLTVMATSTALPPPTEDPNGYYDLNCSFRIRDSSKELWVNGSLLISTTDNTITQAGHVGVDFSGLASGPQGLLSLTAVNVGAVNLRPDAPSVVSVTPTASGATIVLSAYSDTEGDPHTATRLRVYDASTSSVVFSEDFGAITTLVVPDGILQPTTDYEFEAAYSDAGGFGAFNVLYPFATGAPPPAYQTVRPASVITNSGYTTDQGSGVDADILAALQAEDTTYVLSPANPSGSVLRLRLESLQTADGRHIRYQYGKLDDNATDITQTVQIRSPDGNTLLEEFVHVDVGVYPQIAQQDISHLQNLSGQLEVRLIDAVI